MLASLDQTMITTLLADNRFKNKFPDLMEASRRLAVAAQGGKTASCCGGGTTPAQTADGVRNVLSWLKSTIANWPSATQKAFLLDIGQTHLQICYNVNGVVRTVVIG